MFSPASTIAALLSLAAFVSAHGAVLDVYSPDGKVGHGWGVNTEGKFPRSGTSGDAGADSTIFGTSDSPSPACGSTGELGRLDPSAWMPQTSDNVPSAYNNGSIVFKFFQVDADGGGPMRCEYSSDASLTNFQPMTMTQNQPGNFGTLQENNRQNMTLVATFPSGASCTGGETKDMCVVRCRTGVDRNYGSCFTCKLPVKQFLSKVSKHASVNPGHQNAKRDMEVEERGVQGDAAEIVKKTIKLLKAAGYTIPKSQVTSIVKTVMKRLHTSHLAANKKRDFAQHLAEEVESILTK